MTHKCNHAMLFRVVLFQLFLTFHLDLCLSFRCCPRRLPRSWNKSMATTARPTSGH